MQNNNAEGYYGDGQAKGKGNPFYDIYLLEEDECPGKTRQKEDKYKPEYCPDGGQTLKERDSKLEYLTEIHALLPH